MIKGFLTYHKTRSLLTGLLFALIIVSCDIEPDKNSTRTDIESTVLRDCRVVEWNKLVRAGSFTRDDDGRHRIYRCYAKFEIEGACTVPLRMENGQVPQNARFLPLNPGKHDLEVFMDYLESGEEWVLVQVVVSE